MTTRRLRRPAETGVPRGRSGRFGRLGPDSSAMAGLSVKPGKARMNAHRLPQRAAEGAPGRGPLEAGEAATRVDAAARAPPARCQDAVRRDEAEKLALRGASPTAGTGSNRDAHAAGSC